MGKANTLIHAKMPPQRSHLQASTGWKQFRYQRKTRDNHGSDRAERENRCLPQALMPVSSHELVGFHFKTKKCCRHVTSSQHNMYCNKPSVGRQSFFFSSEQPHGSLDVAASFPCCVFLHSAEMQLDDFLTGGDFMTRDHDPRPRQRLLAKIW